MSNFTQMLERIAGRNQPGLGFGPRAAARTSAMALVCLLPRATDAVVEAAIGAGADALILPANGAAPVLEATLKKAAGRPVGVTAHEGLLTRAVVEQLKGMGADFVLIPPARATLDLLELDMGWVMRVDNGFEPEELATFSMFEKVDAVAAAIAMPSRNQQEEDDGYSFHELMRVALVAMSSRRPVLLPLQKHLLPSQVGLARDAGATGLIITPHIVDQTPKAMSETTAAYRKAVDALPRKRPARHGERLAPIVPHVEPAAEPPDEDEGV